MNQKTAIELLLSCLRMGTDEASAARIEHLSAADWEGIVQLSVKHKVAPLLYYRLRTLDLDVLVPANVVQTLRGLYLENAGRNMGLYHILGELLQALRDDDIPVIVLKGTHLAKIVYGNTALRPMNDVDLLVREADLSKATEKLQRIGYAPCGLEFPRNHHHLPPFYRPGAVPVEIHWTIDPPTNPFRIDIDGLWQRAQPAMIAGVDALVLSPEDLLLHLCLHISCQHVFDIHLGAFCDLFEALRRYQDDIDWEQVTLRSRQWRISNSVYLTLYLACEWLGASMPAKVLDALRPEDFESEVVAVAGERVFTDENCTLPLFPNLIQLQRSKRFWDKAIYFLKSVFPPPEAVSQLYPVSPDSPRVYLYYPVRLKDLLLQHSHVVWQLLRGDKKTMAVAEREYILRDWLMWR